MKIAGCLGCEYCHTKGEGKCIQQDDMAKVMPAYLDSDMVVYADPFKYEDVNEVYRTIRQTVKPLAETKKLNITKKLIVMEVK